MRRFLARSARARTTHSPSRSTRPSNARHSVAPAASTGPTPAAWRSSAGPPATTPAAGTRRTDSRRRSSTNGSQLPWHLPHNDTNRCPLLGDKAHPRLQARGPWLDHCGELPLIHGTLVRLKVEHMPGDRDPKPMCLWSSRTGMTGADVDLRCQAFLRRFDLEHTFRLLRRPWVGPSQGPRSAHDRPVDLADHRRPHSAPPCPASRRGSSSALGAVGAASSAGSPLAGAAGGSATSARRLLVPPTCPDRPSPDLDAHPARRTAGQPQATSLGRP